MKALIISNLTKQFQAGHYSMISPLMDLGYEVHWVSNFSEYRGNLSEIGIKTHHIDFIRNPLNYKNIIAYRQLINLLKVENYDLIHCNSPIGGLLGRICGRKVGVKNIIYTAHGFHFYKGAPWLKNFIFKNIERFLSKFCNAIITITKEDYNSALEFNSKAKIFYIPGIGIDRNKIMDIQVDRTEILKKIGIDNKSFVLISAGELNSNKNQEVIIKALSQIKDKNVHYLICGVGPKENELRNLVKDIKLENNVHFLGFRKDVLELMKASDIFVMPSYREGLSRSIMEALVIGLPVIASNIRGNTDLIKNGVNGYLTDPNNFEEIKFNIEKLKQDNKIYKKISNNNRINSITYDIKNIKKCMKDIYSEVLNE